MKIRGLSGLTDLFASVSEKTSGAQEQAKKSALANQGAEAVKLSNDFGRTDKVTDSARASRVQEIKAQVERNEYKPDTREVAVALAKELFF